LGEDAAIIETTSTFRYINWLTNMSWHQFRGDDKISRLLFPS
jgi:hypothetical protein